VVLVFFICPRLFLFDLRSVSLLTFLFLPSFLIAPWTLSHAHGSEQSQAAAMQGYHLNKGAAASQLKST
jgi:hypothetical protein